MSKLDKVSLAGATALGGGLGLIYFKPAGTVMRIDRFLDTLMASPITVEVEHRFTPDFPDNSPVPLLTTQTELRFSVMFNLNNADGLLNEDDNKAEVGLFKVNADPIKSFVLTPETEPKEGSEVVSFMTTSQVLAATSVTETIDQSPALAMLGMRDPNGGEEAEPLRSEQWFEKLGKNIEKYARATNFILEAGESVIVEPSAEELAINPAPRSGNPLKVDLNGGDDEDEAPKPPVPSITREQLEAKRQVRQSYMEEIRKTFRINNRVVYKVPLSQLADHSEIAGVVYDLVANEGGESFDAFASRQISALIESAISRLG